jgi:aminoglycoside phosphotransferase (APT) family kinase protein
MGVGLGVGHMNHFTREYSQRLGVIRGEQLQAALDRFDLGHLLDAAPAPGGLFGQNVFLTSDRGEWVLRGCPHTDWQLPKERFVAQQIHERTRLEAPWPYQIEDSSELFGWPFALMPRLPGVAAAPDDGAEARHYASALGEGLARLHEWTNDVPAYFHPETRKVVPYPATHEDRVLAQIRERVASCREASKATTDDDVDWIESLIAANRSALCEPFQPCWIHHDWKPSNLLALRDQGGWRVVGVIDLMEGYFGDPEEDLVRGIGHFALGDRGRTRRFTSGYRAGRPLRSGYPERYRIYQLMDCLVLWEFGQRNGLWFQEGQPFRPFAENAVETLRPFTDPPAPAAS